MSDENEDATILTRIRDGDRSAFAELVSRHEQAVFRVIRNLLPSASGCEDIAQDVFLSAFARLDSFNPSRASFRTWLLAIARHRCLNVIQKHRPILRTFEVENEHPSDFRLPDTDIQRAEFFHRLDLALADLPFEQRSAFVLAELEELSLADVAQIENVPLGTVKSRLARAREKLRITLADLVEKP